MSWCVQWYIAGGTAQDFLGAGSSVQTVQCAYQMVMNKTVAGVVRCTCDTLCFVAFLFSASCFHILVSF